MVETGKKPSAGQLAAEPVQFSATSQGPATVRQMIEAAL